MWAIIGMVIVIAAGIYYTVVNSMGGSIFIGGH